MSFVNFRSITLLLIALACTFIDSVKPLDPRTLHNDNTRQSHQNCDSIEPPEHGSVKIFQNEFYEFSCEDDYVIQGEPITSCISYKRGKKEKPKCIEPAGTCPKPDPPKNGFVECDEDLIPGKYCRYRCFAGYRLYGSPLRQCMHNNQMSGGARCDRISGNHYSNDFEDSHSMRQYPDPTHPPNPTNIINDDPCLDLQCEQLCLVENGVAQCKCCAGYKINTDKRTCKVNKRERINMNDCLRQHKKIGDVELLSCSEGYIFDYNRKSCIEKSRRPSSVSRPPPPPPPPSSIESCSVNNGGCQYECVTIDFRTVMCRCPNGYELGRDGKLCIVSRPSRPPPPPPPPTSFESCSENNGGCQHECVTTDAQTVMCICPKGYQLDRDGKRCVDINECRTNNFQCSHGCVNFQGGAYCTCPVGFTLDADRRSCIDIDECLEKNKNSCHHYCENTVGSYTCSCKPGYILIEGYTCEGCRRNSFWSYNRNSCVDCPRNSHTDSEGKTSLHDCICDSGFTGRPGDYIPCEDIDECIINNFGCSHACNNIPGGAYCSCPPGFTLDTDDKTCIDIDECSIKNGGCEGLCKNTEGSFECICQEGFTASNKDRYSCDDIDECSENNGGCEHLCINYRGGFFCACKSGYHLDSTLKNCTDIRCPKLPVPHYSHMECKYKNITFHEENTFPVGTKCSFPCGKGFKNIKDDNKMKCQIDGTWIGTLPECKAQSCPPLKVPENGEIHPASCYQHGAKVKEKCTFSCLAGYILDGFPIFTCKNDLTWKREDIPTCKPVKIQPVIKCPEDIQVTLSKGKASENITVPEPTANVKYYEVDPSWVTVNAPVEFPVGVTQVTFTANSSSNEIAQCTMTVTILDEEPPVFYFCPDSITIEGASGSGELVTWEEPIVSDNVKLQSVFSLLEPNVTLSPGTYLVEYVARDSSGNIAKCSFNISVARANCSDLRDPARGKANCMDWLFGKLCRPECDDGYMRNPDEPIYYSCDDGGVWEPNDVISECLEYTQATSSVCQDGFELKKGEMDINEQEVCIACPSNTIWSPTTRKCEK